MKSIGPRVCVGATHCGHITKVFCMRHVTVVSAKFVPKHRLVF